MLKTALSGEKRGDQNAVTVALAGIRNACEGGHSGTRDLIRSLEAVTSASFSVLPGHGYREVSKILNKA